MSSESVRPTIWLLDDSPTETDVIRAALSPSCDVTSFTDGATLLEALGRSPPPDVVVLDWEVPGLSGIEVCEYLRSDRATTALPVLLLTSHHSPEDVARGMEAGANDYVFKPFRSVEFVARVRGLARRGLMQRRALSDERARRVLAEEALEVAQVAEQQAWTMEAERSRLLEQSQQTQRDAEAREAKTLQRADFERRLIGIVSHDLRNPLSAIGLTASNLVRQAPDERLRRGLERILLSVERANRMIRDLLDFTRARQGSGILIERKSSDLHTLVRAVVDEVRTVHPKRSIVVVQSGSGGGEWDPDRLEQVITNLLVNALHYSPPDTPVRVETQGYGDRVVLEVHNSGEPIDPELLPRIFEPLERGSSLADQSGRSIGLGLYIVRHLVEAHGGSASVRSTATEGTAFTVVLPIRPSAEQGLE
ncbi:hybrid sensor histidine kinase/response regulator [Hyalangium versicolor]|uniref:hybrid sensor histidine kinase/response regulator n=1 Tax=Hyalangium versicolor TaxID=2861190 RepID=UPI001CCA09B6|nr:ATP-binding protein [Hyalangium versicolor]